MVWLKIGKHDIAIIVCDSARPVVVWLKIGKHDISIRSCVSVLSCGLIKDWKTRYFNLYYTWYFFVVVWLKIGKHDI